MARIVGWNADDFPQLKPVVRDAARSIKRVEFQPFRGPLGWCWQLDLEHAEFWQAIDEEK